MTLEIAPWLGAPPEGWQRSRLRRLGASASGSGFPPHLQGETGLEIPFYKVKHLGKADPSGVLGEADDTIDLETASQLGATIFPKGTLVYAKVGAALMLGRVRTLPTPACIDNNMAGFTPGLGIDERFLFWAMTQVHFGYLVNPGAVPSLTDRNLLDYPIFLPGLNEQRAIATYLDRETAEVDALVTEQEALLSVFRERRTAVIAQALAEGVTPGVALRGSTLDWIATVPAHWNVANIRRYAQMKTGHTPSRSNPEFWLDCNIPWFTLSDVWQIREGKRRYLGETATQISALGLANSAAELLPPGTVVLSRTASVGFAGIMPKPMATSQDFWNWVCGPKLLPEYLLWVFRGMREEFNALMMGSTHRTIYQPVAASMRIPVPPLEEQHQIADHLIRVTEGIDELIAEAEAMVAIAKERRSSLVTAAMTGRIDVRGEVA